MSEHKLDVAQLQKRDPAAWTAFMAKQMGLKDAVVTAVTTHPLLYAGMVGSLYGSRVARYELELAGCSDPITFIGKRTNASEAYFYRDLAQKIPFLAPVPYVTHIAGDTAWIVMEDVPNAFPPDKWSYADVEGVIGELATLHTMFWEQREVLQSYPWLTHFVDKQNKTYSRDELRAEKAVYFAEGPAALISDHAIQNAGRLAPTLLQAANGLVVMRDLGGWPGVLGESHLAAAADLLDDPVPMLDPLLRLPQTLLHGSPHAYNWRLSLFGERRLLDWRKVVIGPGVLDLITLLEQLNLLQDQQGSGEVLVRPELLATEETLVDSYLLAMKAELAMQFDARAVRQALPAARCLYVLQSWFGYFATWFNQMPDKYIWQRANRMSDAELMGTALQSMVGYRPYLAEVFSRFLHSYRML